MQLKKILSRPVKMMNDRKKSGLAELRRLLPNNLPGALINAFIFADHWDNRRAAREYWKQINPTRKKSFLVGLEGAATVFTKLCSKLCLTVYKGGGVAWPRHRGCMNISLSACGASLFVNATLFDRAGVARRTRGGSVADWFGDEELEREACLVRRLTSRPPPPET